MPNIKELLDYIESKFSYPTKDARRLIEKRLNTYTTNKQKELLDWVLAEVVGGLTIACDDLVPTEWNKAVYDAQERLKYRQRQIIQSKKGKL